MGMLWIKDLRIGLDARKGELALRPGTLVTALNGFITQGGEFQNRKAFVPPGSSFPTDTFGLESTSAGLVCFGSAATPTGFPDFNLGGQNLNYVRCQHPAILAGESPSSNYNATAALISVNYGGFAWCVVTFGDGYSFCYYNGTLINDFVDGLVLPFFNTSADATNAKMKAAIVRWINHSTGYTAVSTGTTTLNVTGPLNTLYDIIITKVSSAGTITQTQGALPVKSVDGVDAHGGFNVVAGSTTSYPISSISGAAGTVTVNTTGNHGLASGDKVVIRGVSVSGYNVDDVTVTVVDPDTFTYSNATTAVASGGTVYVNYIAKVEVNGVTITSAAVPYTVDNVSTAIAVASNIAAYASSPEYDASATNGRVDIERSAVGTAANGFVVKVTARGTVIIGDLRFTFQGTAFTVSTMPVNGTNILTTTFAYPGGSATLSLLVTALQDDINNNTLAGTAHGYLACAVGNQLYFAKAVTASDDAQQTAYFTLTSVTNGSVIADNPVSAIGFLANVSPSTLTKQASSFASTTTAECSVFTSGPPATYLYRWRCISATSFGIDPQFPTERTTKFTVPSQIAFSIAGVTLPRTVQYVCDVTDLNGFTVTTDKLTINILHP